MWPKVTFPFIKRKSGSKLKDKLPISSSCSRGSAWSFSYDLLVDQISKEAAKKEIKSNCSSTEVEEKSISDEEPEDDFIFQGCKKIQELAANDRLRESATVVLKKEDSQEHRISKPGNNLESSTLNEMEQSVDYVKHLLLLLSDVQKQSCLAMIILALVKYVGNSDMNLQKISPQIEVIFINDLQQLLQEITLRSFKDLEQLRLEYSSEKMKWMKQVNFLKERISMLECELQDGTKAYRMATELLTNLKTFYSEQQCMVGRNFNMNPDSQIMTVDSEKHTHCQQKYTTEEEHKDFKSVCYSTRHPELEKNIVINENQISEKKFLNFEKTLSREGSASSNRTFI